MIESVLLAPSTSPAPRADAVPAGEFAGVLDRVANEAANDVPSPEQGITETPAPVTIDEEGGVATDEPEALDDAVDGKAVPAVSVIAPNAAPIAQALVAAVKEVTAVEAAHPGTTAAVQPATAQNVETPELDHGADTPLTAALTSEAVPGTAVQGSSDEVTFAPASEGVAEHSKLPSQTLTDVSATPEQETAAAVQDSLPGTSPTVKMPHAEATDSATALEPSGPTAPESTVLASVVAQVEEALTAESSSSEPPAPVQGADATPVGPEARTQPEFTVQSKAAPSAVVALNDPTPRALAVSVTEVLQTEVWELAKRASLVAPRSVEATVLTEHGQLGLTARHGAAGVQVTLTGDAAAAVDVAGLRLELTGSGIDVSVGTPKQRAEDQERGTFTPTTQKLTTASVGPLSQRSPSSISQLDVLA